MYTYTFYEFGDGKKVKLLHTTTNISAAQQAMLKALGKNPGEIVNTGLNEVCFRPYTVFDGRNAV